MKPAVILVGADKGGVGKTTISRAVLDYLASKSIPARAFDTESPRGALHRFHPHETSIVDISETPGDIDIGGWIQYFSSVGCKYFDGIR